MENALEIAKYFLSYKHDGDGELMSNLKLQKLLYYAQGHYVALNGVDRPLFKEPVEAWQHGPVVREVYDEYKKYKNSHIPRVSVEPDLSEDIKLHLDKVYGQLGKFSAWYLRELTHREAPWLENYVEHANNEISLQSMHSFFASNG